ncbi:PadR family transcriptional regulator [Nocardioides sp. SYSU DS0663]|uniref:PadR family transcriptional regulator n=1 Tax=Nocardioides sp. SYSU DS0663 TaxID=3416445 RepID=UPI003F4C4A28
MADRSRGHAEHPPGWPSEWLRSVLPLCVLAVVAGHEHGTHGYAVGRELADAGLGRVKGGTLYPVLGRLEADGLVTSAWGAGEGGPGRKTFVVTQQGREHLAQRALAWGEFTTLAGALLGVGPPTGRPADPPATPEGSAR